MFSVLCLETISLAYQCDKKCSVFGLAEICLYSHRGGAPVIDGCFWWVSPWHSEGVLTCSDHFQTRGGVITTFSQHLASNRKLESRYFKSSDEFQPMRAELAFGRGPENNSSFRVWASS